MQWLPLMDGITTLYSTLNDCSQAAVIEGPTGQMAG